MYIAGWLTVGTQEENKNAFWDSVLIAIDELPPATPCNNECELRQEEKHVCEYWDESLFNN